MISLIFGYAVLAITRYASPASRFGSTYPSVHGVTLRAIASVSAQNRLRHASTSPTAACTPRKSFAPVASTPFSSSPARKSIFTARPRRDRIARRDHLLGVPTRAIEAMREPAAAGIGRHRQDGLRRGVMQRVVEPRDHPRGVAKRRMRRDILDALAVNVDLAPVANALEVLGSGVRSRSARHVIHRICLNVGAAFTQPPGWLKPAPTTTSASIHRTVF